MLHSFDTYDAIKSFVKGGMTTKLAETVVKTIAASRYADLGNLATKADLAELKTELIEVENRLEKQILEVKADLSIGIEKSKNETLRWVIGMNIATISAVAAMFKFFIN